MKPIIKVCGLTDVENMRMVSEFNPDLFGFIFYSKSQRYVNDNLLIDASISTLKRVGVFVNQPLEEIIQLAKQYQLSWIQLHGDEQPENYIQLLENNLKIVKAFSVNDTFDFKSCEKWLSLSTYFLFDTKGENRGGNGKPFNWSVLNKYTYNIPFLLSGGLSPDNIEQAKLLNFPQLTGFDLNSGIESSAGIKDIEQLKKVYAKL
jgi:phosphoribosylanthranilate isomerase